MKTNEVVALLLPEVRARHTFIYTNENLYEYKDGIYCEITQDTIYSYTSAARSAHYLNEEEITRNVKGEVLSQIKATSLITKEDLEKRTNNDIVAFQNGYINIQDLKEGNIILYPFKTPIEDPNSNLFFSNIPHKLNIQKLDDFKKKWGIDVPIAEQLLQNISPTIYNFFEAQQGPEGIKLQISKIAYCLLRANPYKVFFMELGEKDTGKTTYISLVEKIIGEDNTSHKSIQDISNYSFSAIALHNKLLNLHDDLPRRMITDTGMVKQLTGESVISGHRKFKSDIDFKNYAKLMFTTNELPALRQLDDDAFFSRLVLTIYKHKFERSDFSKLLLQNEDELEGLVLACVLALRDLLSKNSFADNFAEYAEFWRRHVNSIYDFVKTNIENNTLIVNPELRIEKDELYKMYCEFEKEPETKTKFTQELGRLFGISANTHITHENGRQVWAYKGIGIRETKSDEPTPSQNLKPVDLQGSMGMCSACGKVVAKLYEFGGRYYCMDDLPKNSDLEE